MKFFFINAILLLNYSLGIYLPKSKVLRLYEPQYEAQYELDLPNNFDWGNVNGVNYLTKNLNQHIPQYCGSCWAHGALSSLADRVKIARNSSHPDINLAVQFLLNCGTAGTCEGGDHYEAYKFLKEFGPIPFDTCLAYEACSSDSTEIACQNRDFSCKPENICRTCSTFTDSGGKCSAITKYPNVTIESFGRVQGYANMMKEIYNNGPIACGINAGPILNYDGGIITMPNESKEVDHIISIVGWGYNTDTGTKFWKIRNSWGSYWGQLGYISLELGSNQLGIESDCAWAIPEMWTKHNEPCYEDGSNCS